MNFLAIQSKPDISYATSTLSKFMTNPNESHWAALERIFAYFKGTPKLGPTYRKYRKYQNLIGFTDSD